MAASTPDMVFVMAMLVFGFGKATVTAELLRWACTQNEKSEERVFSECECGRNGKSQQLSINQ